MISAASALQRAVHHHLINNQSVVHLLRGPHLYDHVPRGVAYPFVSFGDDLQLDWSTATEHGVEHLLILNVWSSAAGRLEASAVADAIVAALHDRDLALIDHRLINLRHERTETRRHPNGEIVRQILRFRAVTEPLHNRAYRQSHLRE